MSTAATSDPQALVAQALRSVTSIATLPEVTAQIIRIVEDPKSTANQLHRVVSHDPALVTRMLKVVNSAFYGLPGQIASVERAIVLLGLNAVKNLAIAASLGQLFRGTKLCDGFTARDLWTHCIAVAVSSREMARQLKLMVVDEAFLAGMIHDIGILVCLQGSPEKLRAICERVQKTGEDFCAVERDLTGVDHQMLGAGLAEAWKFPRSCQVVAANHHQPLALPEEERLLTGLVYVADTVVSQAGKGFDLTAKNQPLDDIAPQLGIEPSLIGHVRQHLDELLEAAQTAFG